MYKSGASADRAASFLLINKSECISKHPGGAWAINNTKTGAMLEQGWGEDARPSLSRWDGVEGSSMARIPAFRLLFGSEQYMFDTESVMESIARGWDAVVRGWEVWLQRSACSLCPRARLISRRALLAAKDVQGSGVGFRLVLTP